MLRELAGTWSVLDHRRLARTLPQWMAAVFTVITRYGEASGGLALDYYDDERDAAGVRGRGPSPLLREPSREQVEASLRWATKDLWSQDLLDAAADVERMLADIAREEETAGLADLDEDDLADEGEGRLVEPITEPEPAPARGHVTETAAPVVERVRATRTRVDGIASRLVTDVGRGAVIDATTEDRRAVGCARIAAPTACAFCRMMAIRGIVYKNERTAGRSANARFVGAGEFKYHDHCRCTITPYFEGEEWQPQPEIAEWERQYREARAMGGDVIANFYKLLKA
jgi:hypothetical protein